MSPAEAEEGKGRPAADGGHVVSVRGWGRETAVPGYHDRPMKTVLVAKDPMEAHLIAGFLASRGIEAFVQGEMLFGVRAEIGMGSSSAPTVEVRDEDHLRARQALGERLPGGACNR